MVALSWATAGVVLWLLSRQCNEEDHRGRQQFEARPTSRVQHREAAREWVSGNDPMTGVVTEVEAIFQASKVRVPLGSIQPIWLTPPERRTRRTSARGLHRRP